MKSGGLIPSLERKTNIKDQTNKQTAIDHDKWTDRHISEWTNRQTSARVTIYRGVLVWWE